MKAHKKCWYDIFNKIQCMGNGHLRNEEAHQAEDTKTENIEANIG